MKTQRDSKRRKEWPEQTRWKLNGGKVSTSKMICAVWMLGQLHATSCFLQRDIVWIYFTSVLPLSSSFLLWSLFPLLLLSVSHTLRVVTQAYHLFFLLSFELLTL